jgi:hypothetical protein
MTRMVLPRPFLREESRRGQDDPLSRGEQVRGDHFVLFVVCGATQSVSKC